MLEIKDIVNVIINRETSSKTIRDLQTIAILSVHANFATEVSVEYTSATDMITDGFLTTDYAYVAAQRVFSQNPQVRSVVVGKITGGVGVDYPAEIAKLQAANNNWFFLITDAVDDADKEAIATYIEAETAVYVFSNNEADALLQATKTDIFSKIQAKGFVKSIGMHTKDPNVVAPEAAWVGRFASAIIGSNTWIHKSLTSLVPEAFTRTEMSVLKSKNAHSTCEGFLKQLG